jgi:hypothetical protein
VHFRNEFFRHSAAYIREDHTLKEFLPKRVVEICGGKDKGELPGSFPQP